MSRPELHDFLVRTVKNLTPEREELITTVMGEGRRMSARSVVFHAAIADRLGLNPSDHKCADLINDEPGPVTAGRLAEITGLSSGAITGVVDRLEKAGLVARVADAEDRRRVLIQRADRAPVLRNLFMPMMEGMATLCDTYTNEQLALIAGFMQRCAALSEALTQRLQQTQLGPGVGDAIPETPGETPVKAAPPTHKKR
jgi:DNA-binding MarR family transcriptional regulator